MIIFNLPRKTCKLNRNFNNDPKQQLMNEWNKFLYEILLFLWIIYMKEERKIFVSLCPPFFVIFLYFFLWNDVFNGWMNGVSEEPCDAFEKFLNI
jgi:hypothetical protein